MTKNSDKLALDAAKAAALVKSTAEATAQALNIQYMQKDIVEIKADIKTLISNQDGKINLLETKLEALQKQQYMISGGVTILAFAIPLFLKFVVK